MPTRERRPNVIWFFGDQHRAQALSRAGDPNVSTPHVDTLAAEGVEFPRALAGCPWCTPFRGSLLTGRYPQHCVVRTPQVMAPSIPTIAHALEGAGYETAYFGKWHLAWDRSMPLPEINGKPRHDAIPVPREHRGGFRTWIGYNSGVSMFDRFVQGHTADGQEVELHRLDRFETDALTDRLIGFVRGQTAKPDPAGPFFAVCSVKPPHDPYVAPDEYMRHDPAAIRLRPNVPHVPWIRERAREQLAGYYALIENLDHNVGRLMAALDETGLADDTYVVFFSDHGDMHGSHGYYGKSVPWEESLRIPFIVGGGALRDEVRGRRADSVLNTVDIAPTTLALCGVEPVEAMPGFDYSPYVMRTEAPEPLRGEPDSALIQHLVRKLHRHTMNRTWRGVVTRDGWKYVCTESGDLALFDLNDDPYEQHNVVFKEYYKDKRRELVERLRKWLADTGDAYPVPA